MAGRAKLKRKSYFIDERALDRAKKALGVKTDAEVIRLSVERVAEMEEFWEFMKKTRRSLERGSVEKSLVGRSPFSILVFISITGRAGYTKTHSMISSERISFAIRRWSCRNLGAALAAMTPSSLSPSSSNWPLCDGNHPRCPTGGRLADSCDT